MGQRLNLQIINETTNVGLNVYYHWSGYSASALAIGKEFLDMYNKELFKDEDFMVRCAKLLKETGAQFSKKETNYINKYFQPEIAKKLLEGGPEKANRNMGLLSVSPGGILETIYWEEACVEFRFIENKLARVRLGIFYELPNEILDEIIKDEEQSKITVPVNPFGFNSLSLTYVTPEQFKEIHDVVCKDGREWYYFIQQNDDGSKRAFYLIE